MKTVWTTDIFPSPAAINRYTGVLYLHPKLFKELTPFQQKFVKWHEIGHYELDTASEIEADKFAFYKLVGTEFKSMRQCIDCLKQILTLANVPSKERVLAMYKLALKWDYDNGNDWAEKELERVNRINWKEIDILDGGTGSILWGLASWDKADEGDLVYKRAQATALLMSQKSSNEVAAANISKGTSTTIIFAVIILVIVVVLFD